LAGRWDRRSDRINLRSARSSRRDTLDNNFGSTFDRGARAHARACSGAIAATMSFPPPNCEAIAKQAYKSRATFATVLTVVFLSQSRIDLQRDAF
jgi:hypothetical protein